MNTPTTREPMSRHARSLFLLLIVCAGLYLLWYKRVMIVIDLDARMIFIPSSGFGFFVMALLLDSGLLKRDNRSIILACCTGSIAFTLIALGAHVLGSSPALMVLHVASLSAAGFCSGGNFLVLLVGGMRLLPYRYRGRAFAAAFLLAGLVNTATDIGELPFLHVQGMSANLIMSCLSLTACLVLVLLKGGLYNLRAIPIATRDPDVTSRMVRIGVLAVACFLLLFLSLSLKESVVYPTAITGVSPSGFIRFVELPLWLIAGFVTDLLGRRILIIASLIAAFVGAAGTLATSSESVTSLAILCTYFCQIGFPTACCALLADVAFYTRYPSALGFLAFCPLVLGQLLEGVALPILGGLSNDLLFIADVGILALFSCLSVALFSLAGSSLSLLAATVDVIELEGQPHGLATPEQIAANYGLTRREQEILALIVEGKTVRQMADELYVSESTVKFHITNMLKKTDSANRVVMLEKLADPDSAR